MAAHLAGAVSAATLKPVWCTYQWFTGWSGLVAIHCANAWWCPVATVAIGKAGAKNAAYLAAQIGVADADMHQKLIAERAANAEAVIAKDAALQEKLRITTKLTT